MTHLIPAPRPIPTREDRMTEARATATRLAFRAYLTASEVADLDARAAAAEAERDRAREYAADNDAVLEAVHAALDRAGYQSAVHGPADGIALLAAERDKARAELARVRQQRDDLRDHLAHALNDRDRARAELGHAQEVIAEIRNNRERDDRALAMYDTRQGEAEREDSPHEDADPYAPGLALAPDSAADPGSAERRAQDAVPCRGCAACSTAVIEALA